MRVFVFILLFGLIFIVWSLFALEDDIIYPDYKGLHLIPQEIIEYHALNMYKNWYRLNLHVEEGTKEYTACRAFPIYDLEGRVIKYMVVFWNGEGEVPDLQNIWNDINADYFEFEKAFRNMMPFDNYTELSKREKETSLCLKKAIRKNIFAYTIYDAYAEQDWFFPYDYVWPGMFAGLSHPVLFSYPGVIKYLKEHYGKSEINFVGFVYTDIPGGVDYEFLIDGKPYVITTITDPKEGLGMGEPKVYNISECKQKRVWIKKETTGFMLDKYLLVKKLYETKDESLYEQIYDQVREKYKKKYFEMLEFEERQKERMEKNEEMLKSNNEE